MADKLSAFSIPCEVHTMLEQMLFFWSCLCEDVFLYFLLVDILVLCNPTSGRRRIQFIQTGDVSNTFVSVSFHIEMRVLLKHCRLVVVVLFSTLWFVKIF